MFDTLHNTNRSDQRHKQADIWNRLKSRSRSASGYVHDSLERLTQNRINIGITGFSRSGKTTLITSLIYQLLNHHNAALSAFQPIIQGRLLGARWGALSQQHRLFPYQSGIAALSSPSPRWPEPTEEETAGLIELRLKPQNRLLAIGQKPFSSLQVAIHDYPGEWLIDIPMAGMSFAQWSRQWQQLLKAAPRKPLAQAFLAQAGAIDPASPWSEAEMTHLCHCYRQLMQDCRHQAGLTLLQPGMLCFGQPDTTTPFFFPLMTIAADSPALAENSWQAELERRYRQYTQTMIQPFIRRCLKNIDKQLLLADVIDSLAQGPAALADLQQALTQILPIFSYGKNNWLSRLFRPKIDQLVIAATKVDQVLPGQHEAVRQLTADLTREACYKAAFSNIQVTCEAIASVRSSTLALRNGHERLVGTTVEGLYGEMWHPQIPGHLPDSTDWPALNGWQPKNLRPPQALPLARGGPLPHIRLDIVINQLLGDCCQ